MQGQVNMMQKHSQNMNKLLVKSMCPGIYLKFVIILYSIRFIHVCCECKLFYILYAHSSKKTSLTQTTHMRNHEVCLLPSHWPYCRNKAFDLLARMSLRERLHGNLPYPWLTTVELNKVCGKSPSWKKKNTSNFGEWGFLIHILCAAVWIEVSTIQITECPSGDIVQGCYEITMLTSSQSLTKELRADISGM